MSRTARIPPRDSSKPAAAESDLICGVCVAVGEHRSLGGHLGRSADVPERHLAVVLAADDQVHVLGRVAQTADREVGRQRHVGLRQVLCSVATSHTVLQRHE